jgi:ABC-2 type transport system ATP-binding protein
MNGNLVVTARDGGSVVPDLLSLLSGAGIAVKNLSVASPTLDDVFLKYTGHQIRGSDASGDEMNTAMRSFMGLKARR